MSIIHYVHLYLLLSHLHTTIIHRGGVPMLNCAGVKLCKRRGKKGNVTTTHGAGKFGGAAGVVSHPRVNFLSIVVVVRGM